MNERVRVAYIFERYPVLSQTFLRREMGALAEHGVEVEVWSLLAGEPEIAAVPGVRVNYFRWWEVMRLAVALPRELRRDPGLWRNGWKLWRQYGTSGNFRATVWAVIFALCRAQDFRRRQPDILHGVRATGPATAAAVLGRLCRIPFSFGAHAYDIYRQGGDAFLEPKLRAAALVHTSTEMAREYLRERAGEATGKILLARRGLERLPAMKERKAAGRPIRLLSVGRLVAKKGQVFQIAAGAILKRQGVPFEARVVGEGVLRGELQREIGRLGLTKEIMLCGALSEAQVAEQYEWADILWHTGVVDAAGDRDGLPNVIPEAMAQGLPVITTDLAGAREAVSDGVTGLVVAAGDAEALAEAVRRLAGDEGLRRELGMNGRRWVEENFLAAVNVKILAGAFKRINRRDAETQRTEKNS